MPPDTVNVLGLRVSVLNLENAISRVLAAIQRRQRGYVCVRDVHGVIAAQADPALREIHNRAFLVTPDGMPLVWALRRAGYLSAGRVYGPDLMAGVFDRGQAEGVRHFLYGTTPEVLDDLEAGLLRRFPKARIVGRHSPPFRPLSAPEREEIAREIDAARPDIVWVGLSTPKQERWMAEMRDLLEAPLLIGVGAAFDFHAGRKPQAPAALQKRGLEWAFRLATEPRRLWRRYLHVVPAYLVLSTLQRTGLRDFPTATGGDGPRRPAE